MKPVVRPVTQDDCCCVTTVTSATTPTAWTLLFTLCLKEPGSASGRVVFLHQLWTPLWAPSSVCVCVYVCVLSSGVSGVCSVAPPLLGCAVTGRTTTAAVDRVVVSDVVHCVRDSTHTMNSSCSVSSVTGNTRTHFTTESRQDNLTQIQKAVVCVRVSLLRWVHATCQGLSCEEEVEAVADEGFDCSLCRSPGRGGSYGEQRPEPKGTSWYQLESLTRDKGGP